MRTLFCLVLFALAGCSSDPMKGHLVDSENTSEAGQTNYPPQTLREQTFVLSNPIPYQSKHYADRDEIHTALKRAAKLAASSGGEGLIAVPVNVAQGRTTIADVMVYDPARRTLVSNTVYRFSYTPPRGQSLQLDGITATFEAEQEEE